LAACGSSKPSTTTGTTSPSGSAGVKIGFFGALTGSNAQLGINILDGEKLAVQQYNATATTKVTIDQFDSQGAPAQANNGAAKLINDKVVAVIGPAFSGESKVADPIFEQAGIVNVSASATNVTLAQHGYKYFHRVLAADDAQGKGDADYLTNVLHQTTVAVIDDSSTYGEGLASVVRSTLGSKVVLSDHIAPAGLDYGTTVNNIKAKNPGAVFFGGYYDAAGRLVNQLRAKGYTGKFMSGDGSEDQKFVSDAGGAPAENGFLSCPCADASKIAGAQAFVTAYTAAFGTAPAIYSGEAYDATNFVLAAIKSGATTSAAINSYLASNSYTGITKTVQFQADGNVSGGTIYMYQVQSGKIVQIGTTS
jgi:branched-chain amino acid transport system substrate-binding protein